MPLTVVRNDLTKMEVDAIVNTASSRPRFGSGTDMAVYRAAGMAQLTAARLAVGTIEPGAVKATAPFGLAENGVKYILHAVYWNFRRGSEAERKTLEDAYAAALSLAAELGCASIAIPLLGAGNRGWPVDIAIDVALASIYSFLHTHEMDVYLVLFSPVAMEQARKLFPNIPAYVDDDYAEQAEYYQLLRPDPDVRFSILPRSGARREAAGRAAEELPLPSEAGPGSLIEMLDRVMEEKSIKPGDIYNRTSVSRAVLSKVRCNPNYRLGKEKVLEMALVLRLTEAQAETFLSLADYAFNPSRRRDRIIRKCIADGVYDTFAVDELLYAAGEEPLYGEA